MTIVLDLEQVLIKDTVALSSQSLQAEEKQALLMELKGEEKEMNVEKNRGP